MILTIKHSTFPSVRLMNVMSASY